MSEYPQERAFVIKAHAGLARLHALDHVDFDKSQAIEILEQIEQSTLPVQARGVAKACSLCATYLQEVGASDGFVHAFFGLKNLVGQYAEGLIEIDPAFQAVLNGEEANIDAEVTTRNDAAETLAPLIKFADTKSQKSALTFLTQFSENPLANLAPAEQDFDFDRVLQTLSTTTLRAARMRSKTVSFSYVSDIETLSRTRATAIQTVLERVCETIIAFGVSAETKQLSLNVVQSDTGMASTLIWYGLPMSEVHLHRLRQAVSLQNTNLPDVILKLKKGPSPSGLQTLIVEWPYRTAVPLPAVSNETLIGVSA